MRRLLVLLALLFPASAHAQTTVPAPPVSGPFSSPTVGASGGRYAVARYGDDAIAVFDDRAPGWRAIPTPPGCVFEGAVGGGRALLVCVDSSYVRVPTVIDLRTGTLAYLPSPIRGADELHASRLGTRWAELRYSGYHYSLTGYVRLGDGAMRAVDKPRRTADLEARAVDQPLCAPLRRPALPQPGIDNTSRYGVMERDGRSFVFSAGTGVFSWKCGEKRPHRLFPCADVCFEVQVGAGFATARRDDTAIVVRLRDRKRFDVPLGGALSVAHTKHHLLTAGDGTLSFAPLTG